MTEQQAELQVAMAENAAQIKLLLPEGSTPEAILHGDYGVDAQRTFFLGALTWLEYGLTPAHDLEPDKVFDRNSFYSS